MFAGTKNPKIMNNKTTRAEMQKEIDRLKSEINKNLANASTAYNMLSETLRKRNESFLEMSDLSIKKESELTDELTKRESELTMEINRLKSENIKIMSWLPPRKKPLDQSVSIDLINVLNECGINNAYKMSISELRKVAFRIKNIFQESKEL